MSPATPLPARPVRRALSVIGGLAVAAALVLSPGPAAHADGTATPTTTPTPASATPTQGSSIELSATALDQGARLTVTYATDAPDQRNWVGIYREGQVPGMVASTLWEYTPQASGSVDFVADLPAGTYQVWFLAEDGYDVLAGPEAFTVSVPTGTPVPGDPDAPVDIDPVTTDVSTDGVVAREGFDSGGLPEGWNAVADDTMAGRGDAAWRGWTFHTRPEWTADADAMRGRFGRAEQTIAVADAEQFGDHDFDATLTGATMGVSGLGQVRLTFDSHYRGADGQSGVVRASFDGADPIEVLRLDEESLTSGYDGAEMNASHDIVVDVPVGARNAVFSWEFRGGPDARYWAIDSVAVHQVQAPAEGTPTEAWVVSDIQGQPGDLAEAIADLHDLAPDADGLIMAGDTVNSGAAAEWADVAEVMDETAAIRPAQTIAAIGNHERYAAGGFTANRDRFLAFADRDKVWDEYVLAGPGGDLPVIVLGQEFASPSEVAMTDEQVEFLEERLAYWTAQHKQVLVVSHFPLGDTESATWIPGYHTNNMMNDRLTGILGNYPNAIMLNGHTHYPAELGDWAVQRRTVDGHPDGFWGINTLAIQVEWDARGENTSDISEIVTRDVNRGLTVAAYPDRVVVTAHDFDSDKDLREVTIPNPLVDYREVAAPAPTIPAWDPTVVYDKGDTVSYDGRTFEAQWYTLNNVPTATVWESWMEIGPTQQCTTGEVDTWTASRVYDVGATAEYNGVVYRARWWTRNQNPQDPWVSWEEIADC